MAEQSKFSGALARLRQPVPATEPPPAVDPPLPAPEMPAPAAARGKGRPAGKRSDPAWKPYTVLMRKETHKRVSRRLEDMDAGQDLSELVDELLTKWLAQ